MNPFTSEDIAKAFVQMAKERYPTPDKMLGVINGFGMSKLEPPLDIKAQIIFLEAMRDMVNEMSLDRVYKSVQARDDLKNAIIETLEDLYDQLEEIELAEEEEDFLPEEEDEDEEGEVEEEATSEEV